MGLTRAEQETILRWDENEKVVHVYSGSPVTWRKMARLGIPIHREETKAGVATRRAYRIPMDGFRWGLKRHSGPRPAQFKPRESA